MFWWRKVRNHSYWSPGAALHQEGPPYYVPDVKLRPGEEGLSLYAAVDEAEAECVARYFALTQMGYDNLDYLLIPDAVWTALRERAETLGETAGDIPENIWLRPGIVPRNLPTYLATRHYEVLGLTENLEVQLADIILGAPSRQAHRAKKGDIRQIAPLLLQNDSALRGFLHEEWVAKLSLS
jgi:hypothetical protein